MVISRRLTTAWRFVLGFMCIVSPLSARAHPLHTSFVELTYAEGTGSLVASVRVFADDFLRHLGSAGGAGSAVAPQQVEQRAAAYLSRTFSVTDARGRVVPLAWCGWKRNGDLIVICLRGNLAGGLVGARVRNAVLMDLFPDQINILQSTYNSSRHSLLFMPGETMKRLT